MLDELSAVEGSKLSLFVGSVELPLPSVKQEVVELINIHLIVNIDLGILVRLDGEYAILRVHKTTNAPLHVPKQILGLEQEVLSVVSVIDVGIDDELTKFNVHEELSD